LPLKIVRGNHCEIVGRGVVLLSSPPAADQAGPHYTGRMVEEAALLSKAHAVIEREQKRTSDASSLDPATEEFQFSIQRFLDDFEVRCLLEILGGDQPGIEIRTIETGSESKMLIDIVKDRLAGDFDLKISPSNSYGEHDNSKGAPIIQLVLGPEEMGFRKNGVISGIVDAVSMINAKLGHSQADERTSSVLD
jgi:hypothetical protein